MLRRWLGVEMLVAAVGVIGSLGVALIARLTGLTRDDRERARIVRDLDLWKVLPDGSASRAALAAHIDEATEALLAERKKDHRFERLWAAGTWCAFGAWVLLLGLSALPYDANPVGEPFWIAQVRQAMLVATGLGAALAIVFWLVALWVGAPRAWAWLRSRTRR